ncbi:Alpha/beta hydrolase fold-3 domain protein [Chthoniobacter flavus Ellin428]|uniref:Alpha/beta hydrolase fold-3 domain protein n=1 Tax=Chthoniobacter flavus Ellin428 TaxID=497964 RepID=B4D4J1_9BACT|nr:alpha/beta hydrolase [Chthoniobacter flavus]EDY18444.1 Alpha/beta hydrolase fold-3 domain protein [Chthoniobacter flavus Ellin428]TCO91092.1 acetyl esterase/lipase [Chthoniobacter flavus]
MSPARRLAFVLFLALVFPSLASAIDIKRDIEYARVGDLSLKLDLYLPEKAHPPLIVYVHGGAWRGGSKKENPLRPLVDQGFALASIDYRLSTQAPFPAQAHDIKAAIRFLRAQQSQLGIDAHRIVIAGASAGGHLAALVGVTNGDKELEGTVGGNLDQSSDVQGIISLFGASNFMTILEQSTDHGRSVRIPALQLLLGGLPTEKPELARLASPVNHIDAHDPPLLLLHGDADPQMPPEQSKELAAAYEKAGLPVKLVIIPGAVHGGKQFTDPERIALMKEFLESLPTK